MKKIPHVSYAVRAKFWLLPILFLVSSGCTSPAVREIGLDKLAPRKAEQELSAGIHDYEDGNYKAASKHLQSALDAKLTFDSDAIRAHKYLAFIDCASNREKQCREEFKKALELDPKFELAPAEAGHPIWGPVFRGVKAEMEMDSRQKPQQK